ncbi:MAG: MarR family transcriptional regulator [Clostridia bacterium]|nr:MarR family transcriptional regulator [Clostridia bacterium]
MDNRSLVHEIITLNVTHRYRVGKAASSLGLYFGQPAILEFILQNKSCTQKELAIHLHISPASVATTLKRMEKAGFIERIEDKADTRKKHLSVTKKGENALKDFRKLCDETDLQLFAGFSENEKEQLMSYLKRLNGNIADSDLSRDNFKNIMKTQIEESEEIR